MKDFMSRLGDRIKELPFTKGLDDGQYNEGVIDGFERGAYWVMSETRGDLLAILMKEDEKDGIYDATRADKGSMKKPTVEESMEHLNSLIEKAKPNWKNVDIDSGLDEAKGWAD